jgi:hypothetical protein
MRRWSGLLWLAFVAELGACAPETHFLGLAVGDAAAVAPVDSGAARERDVETVTAPEEADTRLADVAADVAGPDVAEAEARDVAPSGTDDAPDAVVKDAGAADLPGDAVDSPSGQDTGIEALRIDVASATDVLRIDTAFDGGDTGFDGGGSIDAGECPSGVVLVGGTDRCLQNGSGQIGSLEWLVFAANKVACMTTYDVPTAFSASWNDSGDAIVELGPTLDGKKSHGALGTISAEFAETKSGTAVGYSYIGIHGWSTSPTRELYIVEDWFGNAPNVVASKVATISVDGASYDVYRRTITSAGQTFDQYYSVRQIARSCGHISVTEHFSRWEALGLTLGAIQALKVSVEAGGGSGRTDFSTATISIR